MAKNNFTGFYLTLSKTVLTLLLGASLYILGTVIQMKYAADTVTLDPEVIPYAVEVIFSLVVIYLSSAFLVVKFRSE